jgi:hypothetical protein
MLWSYNASAAIASRFCATFSTSNRVSDRFIQDSTALEEAR